MRAVLAVLLLVVVPIYFWSMTLTLSKTSLMAISKCSIKPMSGLPSVHEPV